MLAADDQVIPPTSAPAPAPSIPPQPEDMVASSATSSLVAQPELVQESVLETPAAQEELPVQEELAVAKDVEAIVEPVQEMIAPAETAITENRVEDKPAVENPSDDLTGELVAAPETSLELSPAVNDVEDSIAPAAELEVAAVDSVEETVEEAIEETTELAVEPFVEPTEVPMTELAVSDEAETEATESSLLDSALEIDPVDSAVVVAAAPEIAQESTRSLTQQTDTSNQSIARIRKAKAPAAATALTKFRRSSNYSGWLLALLPILAIPVLVWLALRKRRQNAEVNNFANEALSRINSKPAKPATTSSEPANRRLAEVARAGQATTATASSVVKEKASQSNAQSQLDSVVKGVLTKADKKTTASTEVPSVATERKEVATVANDFASYDQFCCIRGIDVATQEALHKAGYVRFSDLEKATQSELKLALSKNEQQYSSSDFSRWSSLAALAGQGDWAGFESLQASHAAPKAPEVRTEQPTVAASTPAVATDDLTKVRGIGPATAELLNGAGITTFRSLADAGTPRLQEILNTGGAKFDAIDPSLWCRQAQFQITGTWTRPHVETVLFETEPAEADEPATAGPSVTITTPAYRITEPTLEFSVASEQAPAATPATTADVSGVLSKKEVERLEKLADTPSQLNEESALLDQINSIREIAAESKASEKTPAAAELKKAPAE